jgi:hypothetical protein
MDLILILNIYWKSPTTQCSKPLYVLGESLKNLIRAGDLLLESVVLEYELPN